MSFSTCPACGAPLMWVVDGREPGRRIALDLHEVAGGPERYVHRDGKLHSVAATWSGLAHTRHVDTCTRPRGRRR